MRFGCRWSKSFFLPTIDLSCFSHTQTQLRAQILDQLKRDRVLRVGPPPGQMSLQRTAVNHMIAGYLEDAEFNYSLTVFREETSLSQGHVLSDHDLMEVLHIGHGSFLHTALTAAKGQGGISLMSLPRCPLGMLLYACPTLIPWRMTTPGTCL